MKTSLVRSVVLAVGLVLALPGEVRAQGQNPYLSAGVRLYSELEPERALEQLKKAQHFAGNTPADDVQIAMYIGLVKFELGDSTGAESDFLTALALDPEVSLPRSVSPKVTTVFEKARKDILKTRPPKVKTSVAQQTAQPPPVDKGTGKVVDARGTDSKTGKQSDVKQVVVKQPPTDEVKVAVVQPDYNRVQQQPDYARVQHPDGNVPPVVEKRSKSYVVPIVLLGVGLAAGGAGGYFGMQADKSVSQAKAAQFQSEAVGPLDSARTQAMTANVMYGAAAVAAVAGVITLLVNSAGE